MRFLTTVHLLICVGVLISTQSSVFAQDRIPAAPPPENKIEASTSANMQGPANQMPASIVRCIPDPDPCPPPPPPPSTPNVAVMQSNGNFVVFGPTGQIMFSTGTAGTGAGIVRVQDDGNLVLYAFVWQAGTYAASSPGPFPPQTCKIATLLHAPQMMFGGQCITSPKGQYMLYIGPDGNLFIYDIAHSIGTWGPGTAGNYGAFLNFQMDGNLVVYDSTGTVGLWNSVTSNTGADLLNMEDDGRIILWRPVWSAQTSRGWDTNTYPHPSCDVGSGTGWTGAIGVGQCFVSPNGRYELLLQSNDHLILLDLSVSPPVSLWTS